MKIDVSRRTIGVNFIEDGIAEVVAWAPEANELVLNVEKNNNIISLKKDLIGFWRIQTRELKAGDRYEFLVDGQEYPDPASLAQPEGVHRASQAVNLKEFQWSDAGWNNVALSDYIIYELHTGTFTSEGTFAAIEEKLDYLRELGITAIEIMPIAQFPGERNWGYDGVYPFAVQNSYGGAEALQHLVNTSHQKGLAVILDVVYNHLGPEGNYLTAYGPFVTGKYKTPWGGAINFDDTWCDGVRFYFIENALMWLRDFHIDALRLDAVHAIKDFSPKHILKEIKEQVDALMQQTCKRYYLIVESDLNDTRFIDASSKGGFGMDAQWIDEFHHALRVTATGEQTGYYSDFNGIEHLAKAYKDAYVYDGQFSNHRKKKFGSIAENNPGQQFVVFAQNHDQVGNRMLGERITQLVSFEMQKLLAGAVMVAPYLPMLFMGEEWSEPNPFLYFVSHTDRALTEAVRKGRKEEFAAFHADGEAPDPDAEETFLSSKLQWNLIEKGTHKLMVHYYQWLIAIRKKHPALYTLNRKQLHIDVAVENKVLILYRWQDAEYILCLMNFSNKVQQYMPLSFEYEWFKVFDSAAKEWNGPFDAPESFDGTKPGKQTIDLQPESILIYSNHV